MNYSDDLSAGRGKPLPEPGDASTKPKRGMKKGYYVRGVFVAEGSELDLELKSEFANSRSVAKAESTELQELGESMLNLSQTALAKLAVSDISEKLHDAVLEAKRITNFEGKRRQMQYIGKMMRKTDPEPIRLAIEAARTGNATDALALHRAEKWRDELIAHDDALQRWIVEHPAATSGVDSQQLRSLIRQARKDAAAIQTATQAAIAAQETNPTACAPSPHPQRAYKEIFQLLRAALQEAGNAPATMADSEED